MSRAPFVSLSLSLSPLLYTNAIYKYIYILILLINILLSNAQLIRLLIKYHRRWKLANNVLENLSQLYLPTGLFGLLTVSKGDRSTVQLVFVTKRLVFVTKRLYIKVLTRNKLKPFWPKVNPVIRFRITTNLWPEALSLTRVRDIIVPFAPPVQNRSNWLYHIHKFLALSRNLNL